MSLPRSTSRSAFKLEGIVAKRAGWCTQPALQRVGSALRRATAVCGGITGGATGGDQAGNAGAQLASSNVSNENGNP